MALAPDGFTASLPFYQAVLAGAPVPMAVFAAHGQCLIANDAAAHYYGVARQELLALNFHDIRVMRSSGVLDDCLAALCDGQPRRREFETRKLSGESIWVDCQVQPVRTDGQHCLLLQFTDQTRAKKAETALRGNLAYLNSLLRAIPDPIWLKDRHGVFLSCNAAFEQLLGASEAGIVGKTDDDFFDQALADSFRQQDRTALAAGQPVSHEEVLPSADGRDQRVFETVKAPVLQSTGEVLGVLGIARDISARKRHEEALRDFAFHDPLTQLPNRRLCLDRLAKALQACRRHGGHGAVIFLDLNRFKPLNDRFGHEAGDQLLIEVARRLRAALRASDTVARFGGDEFVVLLEGLGAELAPAQCYAQQVSAKVEGLLAQEYLLGSVRYCCSASLGLRVFTGDAADPDQVIRDADAAMYLVKSSRRAG